MRTAIDFLNLIEFIIQIFDVVAFYNERKKKEMVKEKQKQNSFHPLTI